MFQDITLEELFEMRKADKLQMIDVRSPSEWAEFTIPGSINIPFFDDAEREEIGTLYKQVSVQQAKERGLEIMSAKLPSFVKQFAEIPERKVVFCWRGGMRSKTTATVLSLMGIHVYRLSGGIRTYRQWVLSTLEQFHFKPKCIVLSGHTGTGKTKILHALAEQGYPVIDLEQLAGHRGSIFGGIGLVSNNQKAFESLLLEELLKWNDSPYVLVEAESKRIGKVVLPPFLVEAKAKGTQIQIELPIAVRVENIMEDYQPNKHEEACLEAFQFIQKRIHTPIALQIEQALRTKRFDEAIELLLQYYYDSRYEFAGQQYDTTKVECQANNVEEAVTQIKSHLQVLT